MYHSYEPDGQTTMRFRSYVKNPYRYNAERVDYIPGIADFQYLRARYYTPDTARFIQQDTVWGKIDVPLSQNLYAYCGNNPLNFVDPSGHYPKEAEEYYWDAIDKAVQNYTALERYQDKVYSQMDKMYMQSQMRMYEKQIASYEQTLSMMTGNPVTNSIRKAKKEAAREACENNFVGYLKYGAKEITTNSDEGFFRLYSKPTFFGPTAIYFTSELYKEYNMIPKNALQTFGGGGSVLNKSEFGKDEIKKAASYGGQQLDIEKGTLMYNGMERYAIALGPKLQNPKADLSGKIKVSEMIYGTCVDISIELDGSTYYIPAIIIDVKAHTAPTGIFQTGKLFNGKQEDTDKDNIVEWYTYQYPNGNMDKNKSEGLNFFNSKASIIIYGDERMYYGGEQ